MAGSRPDREEMILSDQQQRSVVNLAKNIRRRFGAQAPLEDLIQAGQIGLISAVDSYDGSVPLFAYTHHRMRGAMLDFIRSNYFRGMTPRKRPDLFEQPPKVVAMDAAVKRARCECDDRDVLALSRLQAARAKLTPRLQLIVSEYYEKERTNSDIGLSLGVGETRVHQLHRGALKKLRNMMSQQEERHDA